ncbi:MAG: hypothetical protein NVSMB7_15360 [Chitinophagaceae bacterium]
MYKIKIFSAEKTGALQNAINEWLQMNRDILIHSSNLTGSNGENLGANEYNFYILYASTDNQTEELKEMAAAVTQDQSVEVKEINPEILKPSS